MSTDIIIVGALGRMGIEIANAALSDHEVRIAGSVEYARHFKIGYDYGECIKADVGGIKVVSSIEETGVKNAVVIDFSSPQSVRANLEAAPGLKMPMVIGTTGLGKEDYALAKKAAETVPIIVSSNMSLGVNLLFFMTELVAGRLGGAFDIEIIEAHHRMKKDSPSGTARTLGEIAAKAIGRTYDEAVVNGRAGIIEGERPPLEIGMHAIRGGDIVGDHTVLFAGIGESIELRHMAHSRGVFAQGALTTAKWIASKEPGYYSMRDVLGIK